MNKLKKIISLFLAVLMFFTLNSFSLVLYAAETGTEESPIQISTAQQLQNINSNPSACYKLTANIDLKNIDFTPIGNADSGAFSGVFDGNGFIVSNLNVSSGKYAGLFGCNEGLIKNVTLSNVYVCGTRYLGGVVGENTSSGKIVNCKVNSGKIVSDGGLKEVYAGGICGYNSGVMEGAFSNSASVKINSNTKSSYSGGIIGYTSSTVNLEDCSNNGTIYSRSSSYSYSGGIIGKGTGTVTNCYNTGNISSSSSASSSSDSNSFSGGIIGFAYSNSTITNCYNTGNVSSYSSSSYSSNSSFTYSYSGGIIGFASSASVTNCYNTGNVSSSSSSSNKTYSSYTYSYSGGIIGKGTGTVTNCYNTGNISSSSSSTYSYDNYNSYSGGIIGFAYSNSTITNCYNTGNISAPSEYYGGIIGEGSSNVSSCYFTGARFGNTMNSRGTIAIKSQLRTKEFYSGWDFEDTWDINPSINDGLPILKNSCSSFQLDKSNYYITSGNTFKLNALSNGKVTADVKWSVSYGKSNVSQNGIVTAVSGFSTITAVDSLGNKANCNIYVCDSVGTFTSINRTIDISEGRTSNSSYLYISGGIGDRIVEMSSSNPSVVSVNGDGSLLPLVIGTAKITAVSASGKTAVQEITVVSNATSISLPSSVSISKGENRKLYTSTKPNTITNKIIWRTSNADIATVDQNGNVSAVGVGSCTITATTDNGKQASCTVTVSEPQLTSMSFEKSSVTLYVNDTRKLNLVLSPSATSSTVSFSSSSADGLLVDSHGVVTAKKAGSYTVTATSSNGIVASCTVNVISYPVVVTGVSLDTSEKTLNIGEVFKLNATVTPNDASNPTVIWESTNEDVATVSQGGTVEAKGAGKAIISASTQNGVVSYCTVNVNGKINSNHSKIFIPDVSLTNREYVDVPVYIENNPGISFASISVSYDSEKLEPEQVINGTVFASVTGSFDKENGKVNLYFTSNEDVVGNGTLAVIRFKVIKLEKELLAVKVMYLPGGVRNSKKDDVSVNLSDGSIEIEVCIHEHTELKNAKNATCSEQGYSGDLYCLDCGALIKQGESLPTISHNFEDTVVEATENKKGYTKHICSICGFSYVDNITDYLSDNSALLAVLSQIELCSKEDYSAETYDNLLATYNSYSDLKNQNVSQVEIDNAVYDLLTAIYNLEPYMNLDISAPNGSFTVSYDNQTNSDSKHSLPFGTNISLSATPNEGYKFTGWYDVVNNLYFSKNSEYTFKLTSNVQLKALFVKSDSATLKFVSYSNWVKSIVTKTIDEWNTMTSIEALLPDVPYRYGYSNGRWVYDNEEVLSKLKAGQDVSLTPVYDKNDLSLPNPPLPNGDTPVLDLHYNFDDSENVASFVMATGFPENIKIETIAIAFYYGEAEVFDPTKFEVLVNNKMFISRFNTDEVGHIYISNMRELSLTHNWAVRGYVTYYDSNGNLKTVYSNQVNIVNRKQV
ncbi:Ig-like domain-containing protein [Eubacterium coprostanoligenes]|uniref:Ig-like domain-containing protein n=1 Tax=Eubacterium coprostanoligenes TaxID=290054 RepID=UPI002A831A39|nr:Ig-like domain-containing protein [Eubacterium coprostanoligenes]MDY4699490.1 Ig-like domain-containing protein [Eubacterium coprostanoligenes]